MTDYRWDASCADLELARLGAGFTGYDHANFARVLLMGLQRVIADIHVDTGRLRSSADASVETSDSSRWEAQIDVGGPGIPYAASEFFGYSPKHGGYPSHAYFRRIGWQPLPRGAGEQWVQAPIRDTGSSQGVPIEEDLIGPTASFISRGRQTPHPHGAVK